MILSKKRINLSETSHLKKIFRDKGLHTVCESALCPNIGECFAKKTATFLICGDICTRGCGFCGVGKGVPGPLDSSEPEKIALAVKSLGLKYVVITSVTRDDISDGGAEHFALTVENIRKQNPVTKIEVLVPDFNGNTDSLKTVFRSKPDVFSHNIETVPSLYKKVRHGANYQNSLLLLKQAVASGLVGKSSLMLGLGETRDEIISTMKDIYSTGCRILTLGQYLAPTKTHFPVKRFLTDKEFESLQEIALNTGFARCSSGPYVRSSYLAESLVS